MRSGFFMMLLTLVVLGAVLALYVHEQPTTSGPAEQPATATTTAPAPPPPTPPTPPLAERVGQLFMVGHWANTPAASTTALIKKYHLGGVLIMSAPADPTDIKDWVSDWNNVSSVPLLVGIDQEGGVVSRLRGADFSTTSQRDIVDPDTAYQVGKKRGHELASLGINLNLAPVLETATHPDSFMYERVFPDRKKSAALTAAILSGMVSSGVIGVVKHFPGHPDTPADSHQELPMVDIPRSGLDDFTAPWRELFSTKPPAAVMTAHVEYPQIDTKPATLSPFFLTEYLRHELGFAGVVITDDMIMKAVASSTDSATASVQALTAGADIILFAAEPTKAAPAISAVLEAVDNGTLPEERINESYQRVLTLKALMPTTVTSDSL